MKIKIKITAIIFIAIMILCSATACSENAGNSIENDTETAEQVTDQQEEDQIVLSEAPVKNYEGYEYRILSKGESYGLWEGTDVNAEGETGDLINDAVYARNIKIEDLYNIHIVNKPSSDLPSSAKKAITAGDDEYDIMMGSLNGFADTLSQEGMLVDLTNVPYLDLDKPWYDQNANEQLSIGHKLYVTVSDIGKVDNDATWAYLFNKKIVENLSLENLYELVRNGAWTIDKMLEMCKDVSYDFNGDGKMDADDMYGYAGEAYNLYMGLLSANHEIIKKDDNDLPYYAGIDDVGINSFTKLLSVIGDKTIALRADDYYGGGKEVWGGSGVMDSAFKEDRVLFFNTSIARVTFYRNMESDFGIIPTPKRDEAQEEYISTVSAISTTSLCIPVTVLDYERTGIITDALAAESYYTLKPAYYELQLKTKISRDDESAEMLDTIFAGRKFDLGLLYNWASVVSVFEQAGQKNSTDIVSALEKIQDKINGEIEKTIAAYESFTD